MEEWDVIPFRSMYKTMPPSEAIVLGIVHHLGAHAARVYAKELAFSYLK